MDRFCDELRNERERQGLSLAAISDATKISARHLLALETGDYAELPGGVFRKGFLRSYVMALGLDEQPWLARFEEELRATGVLEPEQPDFEQVAMNIRRAQPMSEPDARLRWSGVLVMLVLLLAFGWCVWHFALVGHVSLAAVSAPAFGEQLA